MKRPSSLIELLDQIPPPLARLIARDKGSRAMPLTDTVIAGAAGIPMKKVVWISRQTSWRSITVGEAEAFLRGCGITMANWRSQLRYIRRTRMAATPTPHLGRLRSSSVRSLERAVWKALEERTRRYPSAAR